jgi:hypothetical protein
VERIYIDVSAHSEAASEVVFGLLADGTSWPDWSPIESFELERPGDPPPEGVGAIRVFRKDGTTGRDQIVELVPGRRLSYVSLSGPPSATTARRSISRAQEKAPRSSGGRRSLPGSLAPAGFWTGAPVLPRGVRTRACRARGARPNVPTTTDQAGAAPLGARRRRLAAVLDASLRRSPMR